VELVAGFLPGREEGAGVKTDPLETGPKPGGPRAICASPEQPAEGQVLWVRSAAEAQGWGRGVVGVPSLGSRSSRPIREEAVKLEFPRARGRTPVANNAVENTSFGMQNDDPVYDSILQVGFTESAHTGGKVRRLATVRPNGPICSFSNFGWEENRFDAAPRAEQSRVSGRERYDSGDPSRPAGGNSKEPKGRCAESPGNGPEGPGRRVPALGLKARTAHGGVDADVSQR